MRKCLFSCSCHILRHLPISRKAERMDSNPCALADKRFSRPPRYDHFDTSPRQFFQTSEALNSISSLYRSLCSRVHCSRGAGNQYISTFGSRCQQLFAGKMQLFLHTFQSFAFFPGFLCHFSGILSPENQERMAVRTSHHHR